MVALQEQVRGVRVQTDAERDRERDTYKVRGHVQSASVCE
jgi:hypothetical protein